MICKIWTDTDKNIFDLVQCDKVREDNGNIYFYNKSHQPTNVQNWLRIEFELIAAYAPWDWDRMIKISD